MCVCGVFPDVPHLFCVFGSSRLSGGAYRAVHESVGRGGTMPTSPSFTERRQQVLKLVIQEFIERAVPVASETLVRKHDLPFSAATVRNELAALEELGYLSQLHASAGRIPTNAAYRFFVQNFMDCMTLSEQEQRAIGSQFTQVGYDLEQWIQVAASLLARTTKNASVVTPPRAYETRFKHVELIAIHETVALMVLVLQDGTVHHQTLVLETAYTQSDLRTLSDGVNDICNDASAVRIQELLNHHKQQQSPTIDTCTLFVLEMVVQAMRQVEDQMNEQIHSDGLVEMLSQPEFIPALVKEEDSGRAIERVQQMLDILTSNKILGALILQALASDGVQVIIGDEHDNEEMRSYSVVLSRYGVDGTAAGVLGIIGPTRMSYPRSISTVRYVSFVMSELLHNLYSNEVRTPESV